VHLAPAIFNHDEPGVHIDCLDGYYCSHLASDANGWMLWRLVNNAFLKDNPGVSHFLFGGFTNFAVKRCKIFCRDPIPNTQIAYLDDFFLGDNGNLVALWPLQGDFLGLRIDRDDFAFDGNNHGAGALGLHRMMIALVMRRNSLACEQHKRCVKQQ